MRKEIDFGQGRTLVFESCGPNQFVISMLADYQANAPPADKLTGRAIKYYTCLTGLVMVDKLRDAVNEWYKENTQDPVMPGGKLNAVSEALREQMSAPAPVPMLLTCPMCTKRHIDEGEFATKGHHTHACQSCGHVWRPALVMTVGVKFLPGFKNPPVVDLCGLNEPSTKDRLHDLEKKVAYKKSVTKRQWYRITFDTSQQVVEAVRTTDKQWPYQLRAECRDFDDGMHCLHPSGSLAPSGRQGLRVRAPVRWLQEEHGQVTKYVMQIKTPEGWQSVHPLDGEPYAYKTREEAESVLRMCYPDQVAWGDNKVRVKEEEGEVRDAG